MLTPLADLADLGGFFELTDPTGTDAVGWVDLLGADRLAPRLEQVRGRLALSTSQPPEQVEAKVAVSALQVGLASRVWSVALATAVLHRWVPDLSSANLLGSPDHGGPVPLGLADPSRGVAVPDLADARDLLAATVVDGSLADLDRACARVGRTPRRVLLSNSASSLVGAARVLARVRPTVGPDAWRLVRALLKVPGLTDGGQVRAAADLPQGVGGVMEAPTEAFLRRGCCLFDRIPGHGLCPDCVRAERRPDLVTPGH